MIIGGTILIIAMLVSLTAVYLRHIWKPARHSNPPAKHQPTAAKASSHKLQSGSAAIEALSQAAQEDVDHIFNEEFREELRNRGRLHFEKALGENVMFLQQDLRESISQLNEYLRTELLRTLQGEFKNYQQSINDARQLAINSIDKTVETIDQQRRFLETQLVAQTQAQKEHMIKQFEAEMANIVNHYVLQAIGSQIDITDQLDFILSELEANKQAIVEDIKRGA